MRRLLLLACLVLVRPAWAAVTANSFVTPQTPNRGINQILNATSTIAVAANNASVTGTVTLFTAGANGSKVVGIFCGTNDTLANVVGLFIINASKVYWLTSVSVPAASGSAVGGGTPVVNMLSSTNTPGLPFDKDGNPYLLLASGDALAIGVWTTAVATNKAVTCTALGMDY